jgi:hypothetical protein
MEDTLGAQQSALTQVHCTLCTGGLSAPNLKPRGVGCIKVAESHLALLIKIPNITDA